MHTGLNKFLLFEIWRSWAARRTPYAPLGIPAVLFRSEEHAPEAAYDLGWGTVYEDLRVIPVRGGHSSMFDPANLESVTTAFLGAVEAARASACIGSSS